MPKYPTAEQIETLLKGPADTPVVMLNLLKFNKKAQGTDEDLSGQAAYGKYAASMKEFVESKGGRFIWAGRVDSMVIGEGSEEFDMVGLVEYPSRQAFIEIASSQTVKEIGGDRESGLDHQWLLACTERSISKFGNED